MNKEYTLGVFIGRFQVPEMHEGHRYVVNVMLQQCDSVLILVGSANRARSVKNPFSFSERKVGILKTFPKNVAVLPLNDYLYSDSQWKADVATAVSHHIALLNRPVDQQVKVVLYGHYKEGNDYLNWFPQFSEYVNVTSNIDISGTEIRRAHKHLLPDTVQNDIDYFDAEKLRFMSYPFPEALNVSCGDAVVECDGHVLLIQRKRAPGEGTWALPGGHKNNNETFTDCILRELREETNLRVPLKVLKGSIVKTQLFDHPARSGGLTRISLAALFRVSRNADGSMPRANGADDAAEAKWVTLDDALNKLRLYDDHADIISEMTGVRPKMAIFNLQNL